MKRPSINALRTFEAAGRCLNFSQAANELNISQAAVSQQIRKLEDYLESPLFIRQNRQLRLTSNGRAYHNVVHQTIERLNSTTDQLFPQTHKGIVTISCSPSVATLWLVPHLGTMQKQYPHIEIRINTLDYQLAQGQSSGSDIEISMHSDTKADKVQEKLMQVNILPVCARGLFKTLDGITDPSQIQKYPLIHVLGYNNDWYRWFKRYHINHGQLSAGLSFDGSLIAIEAALRGEGVMLGRRPFIDHHLQSGDLIEVFEGQMNLLANCFIRVAKPNKPNRNLSVVTNWLKTLARQSETSASPRETK